MLNVSYENRIGYCTLTQGEDEFRIDFCHANCLCAMMYFYKEEDGTEMVRVHCFFADLAHAKRCIDGGVLEGHDDFHFVKKEMDRSMMAFARHLEKRGFKVTIE